MKQKWSTRKKQNIVVTEVKKINKDEQVIAVEKAEEMNTYESRIQKLESTIYPFRKQIVHMKPLKPVSLLRMLLFHQFTNFSTMKRKEIQRKFHDSLINMLYTPPSPPPPENKYDRQTLDLAREIAN